MGHNPIAEFQIGIDWQAPLTEFEQGFYLRESITPRIGIAYGFTIPMSVKPGGTVGPLQFNNQNSPSKLTFAGLELRLLDNTEYIYIEQDGEFLGDAGNSVPFDGGVGKSIGSDLTFDAGTFEITSTAGGLFLAYLVLNLAQR